VLAPTELRGGCLTRRGFITLLGISALTWAHAVCAQQPEPIRRVGVLHSTAADDPEGEARMAAFLQGLQQAGWTIGRNLTIYTRWGRANADEIRKFAEELGSIFDLMWVRRHIRHGQNNWHTPPVTRSWQDVRSI
jgi:hypothetical protein